MKPNSRLLDGAEIGERTILDTHVYAGPDRKCRIRVRAKGGTEEAPARLSFTSEEYVKQSSTGRWLDGSGGQFQPSESQGYGIDEFHDALIAAWDRWHLNDMRAGCEHVQGGDRDEKIEVVEYGLTTEAYTIRKDMIEKAGRAAARGIVQPMTPTERALVMLDDWFRPRYSPPDADSPLSGCFEVKKREMKAAGWVTEKEHPKGLLSKACPTCGYKYGNAWLREAIPADLVRWLKSRGAEGSPCLDTPPTRVRRADGSLVKCGDADDPCK